MSDPRWPLRHRALSGFTLVEVLVVLVVIGLIAGVALPRLLTIAQRFHLTTQREQLQFEIGSLGYKAYRAGRTMVLERGAIEPDAQVLSVPAGWRLEVLTPIRYHFSGVCSGGRLTVFSPDGQSEQWVLPAPMCQPQRQAQRTSP